MEALSRATRVVLTNPSLITPKQCSLFPSLFSNYHARAFSAKIVTVSVLRSPRPVDAEEDILREFFRDRELNGDFITRYSDIIFKRRIDVFDDDMCSGTFKETSQPAEEALNDEPEGGFLKLAKTQEWLLGEDTAAPVNKKPLNKDFRDNRERRKALDFLNYEALKRELLLVTAGVGAACSGYCLVVLSVEAAVSYAVGVVFSFLYLQLLYQHVDNISKESVPQTFTRKRSKKIGIRSEDLKDVLEKSVRGSGIALSSPRLVIPAAIFGAWVLLHQSVANDFFKFQIVPAMLGLFAYKAAALVQVYRDNEDLQFIFPENEQNSGN